MQKADTDTEMETHTEDTDAIPERETPPMTPRGPSQMREPSTERAGSTNTPTRKPDHTHRDDTAQAHTKHARTTDLMAHERETLTHRRTESQKEDKNTIPAHREAAYLQGTAW